MDAKVKPFPADAELERATRPTREEAEAAVETLIRWAGDDPSRDGLRDTPGRVVRAYEEIFGGYAQEPSDFLERTFSESAGYDDFVLVRDIAFISHCEHHLAPIIGKAHVAYCPSGRILGLSKIARVVDAFARRLQTQETMTRQIALALDDALSPSGIAVVVEAEHLCMSMRGIRSRGSITATSAFLGSFREDANERARLMALLARA